MVLHRTQMMQRKFRLVCDAQPYCYGPAATLLTLISHIEPLAEVIVLATGTAFELVSRVEALTVLPCDTRDVRAVEQYRDLISSCDIALSVMGGPLLKVARSIGVSTAYVDGLFWIWPGISDPSLGQCDLYFIEDHFNARDELVRLQTKISHPIVIPPILGHTQRTTDDRRTPLLITLGGVTNGFESIAESADYLRVVSTALATSISSLKTSEPVLLATGEVAAKMITNILGSESQIRAVSLSHEQYLHELSQCKLLISHPGLYTPLEAFSLGVPVAFLPPLNYSQHIQLRRFRELGCAPLAVAWETFLGIEQIPEDLQEKEGARRIIECSQHAGRLPGSSSSLQHIFSSWLETSPTQREQLFREQAAFLDGRHDGGASEVTGALADWLKSRDNFL